MTLKLLALPCAGASATMYLRWRRHLSPVVQLIPLELPGRGTRMNEPCEENFLALVRKLCAEYAQHLQGDYVLFGHSMGALLAYGMALHQRQHKYPLPRALLVSASPAPSVRDPDRFANKDTDQALIEDLRDQGGTPEAVFANAELLRMTLDTLGADYRVCDTFSHDEPARLPVPLHVLAGKNDDIKPDSLHAWRQEGAGRFTLDWFEGNHFFIWQQQAQVLERINHLLRSV
ncbi:MAG TPA: alpha/beta fold hydrolase [Alcaligenes sp.]|nr:alpha/beta fold hydrolase [Alcaligenes sp.]HRL28200.1 alpha/beta fold hydrolase [Alcaligenes sp.]